jgi:hypothetical protein
MVDVQHFDGRMECADFRRSGADRGRMAGAKAPQRLIDADPADSGAARWR